MNTDISPWWERFFGGDNRLRWSTVRDAANAWSPHVLPWIDLAQDNDTNFPVILPRLDADNQPSWYFAGRNARGALRLREAIQAFIGPSYSDFNGRPHELNVNDPVEAAFAEGTIAPAFRLRASSPADVFRIQRALDLYCGIIKRTPITEQQVRRPLGSLRTELDRAVAAGDEAEASRLLERIRGVGRLDAENLLYLELGVKAGLGHWREIAEDGALLNQLTGLRLPPRVLGDVHEALYRLHVEPSEDANAPNQALEAFRAAGLTRRSTLFSSRRGLRSAPVLKAFFLYALAREDPGQPQLADLASELKQLDDAFAHALAGLRPETEPLPPSDPARAADEAFDNLETDRALDLYLQIPPSRKRVTRLIRCAQDVGTAEAARRVIEAITPGDDVENLPASWSQRLKALEQMCALDQGKQQPKGWLDWARQVDAGMSEEDAMNTLREQMGNWDSTALINQKGYAEELAAIINSANGSADAVFREATPLLYQALLPHSEMPSRQIKPLLQILVTKVAFLADPSRIELELARDITSALLVIGLDAKDYASLISDLEDLMSTQMCVFTLSWALDLAELFAIHACPDREQRLRLIVRVVEEARHLVHRLSSTDALVVEQLCQDNAIECPLEIRERKGAHIDKVRDELCIKSIAIYTLVEPAGQRVVTVLKKICPNLKVALNSDHECTNALSELARSADLFVFAWKSSKHQAFYCVKKHRNTSRPLIQAAGKGTSSILRAVIESA